VGFAIQGGHRLARVGATDDDGNRRWLSERGLRPTGLARVQAAIVKGVQRLAPLEHDIIGNVDDVVDGPHPRQEQTTLHPLRGGANRHAGDEGCAIARTQVGIGDLDLYPAGDRLASSLDAGFGQV